MAGMAGVLLASYIGFVSPHDFSLLQSLLLSAIVTAGGLASIEGSFLAALLWVMAQEWLRYVPGIDSSNVGQVRMLLLGIGLIFLMFVRPRGLLGQFRI
jgi:branched-chain amino acid transport system permease protein